MLKEFFSSAVLPATAPAAIIVVNIVGSNPEAAAVIVAATGPKDFDF